VTGIKVASLNLLSDLSLWEKRRSLIVEGLAALEPDLVALQEVDIRSNNALWLAGELNLRHIHLSQKTGEAGEREGIAILSRLPFEKIDTLDLRTQNRIAQYGQVRIDGQVLVIANAHLYWQPGESIERLEQARLLLEWLQNSHGDVAQVLCGDFNGTPNTVAIRSIKERYRSAYEAIHGHEPEYTTPTPLRRSKKAMLRTLLGFLPNLRLSGFELNWRGTLDYIFVNEQVEVRDCRLMLNQPAKDDARLYPSDHFGLYAILF
jgi:endonuclease/exonuclease/phosphatase family metal-dependent hydrolase